MAWRGLQIGIKKAKKRVPRWWYGNNESDYLLSLRIARRTTKRCSYWCCGNRRQYMGLSYQERKMIYSMDIYE